MEKLYLRNRSELLKAAARLGFSGTVHASTPDPRDIPISCLGGWQGYNVLTLSPLRGDEKSCPVHACCLHIWDVVTTPDSRDIPISCLGGWQGYNVLTLSP